VTRAFDVAYFFRCAPSIVLALSIREFLEWERQAHRLFALNRRPE
jgi:hypothetical protein